MNHKVDMTFPFTMGIKCIFYRTRQEHSFYNIASSAFLEAALLFSQMSQELVGEKMETERFYDASTNGGFPAWEPQRPFRWLEKLNPTEFFEDTLIETDEVFSQR